MNAVFSLLNQLSQTAWDRVTGAEQPKLYINPKGQIQETVGALTQLQEKYRPTPWLSNTHAHLLYFDVIRKRRIQLEYDHFDQLEMQDGGVTGIMWFGYDLPEATSTVVVMHTITGSPESMREVVRDLNRYTGWRVALCLRRGHADLPMPVPKMNLFGSTDDLREQIAFIQSTFPSSMLYAVGSSAGTGLLVRYLGEEGSQTPFKAAFALCPGYNTELGFVNVHPFYSKVMTKKLFKKFIFPYQQTWQQTASVSQVLMTKTLAEFESSYYEMAGYVDYDSYNQATNPIYVFENVTIPLLILNAEDDPVCHIKNFEPYKDMIRQMPNIGGVPLATWLSQNTSWRMAFAAISILGIMTILALWKALPQDHDVVKPNVAKELRVLTRAPVVLALLNTVMSAGAMFALYTYIAPSLHVFMQASPQTITLMLVLIGIGFSIGNHLGGKFADLSLEKTLIGFLILLMVMMLVFPVLAQTTVGAAIGLVIWGTAAFAVVPPLQMRVMSVAADAPGLASSVNIGAFNLGNALGAFAGATVLSMQLSYTAVSYAGAALSFMALILVLLQMKFGLSKKACEAV